jgi:hypothetical protein
MRTKTDKRGGRGVRGDAMRGRKAGRKEGRKKERIDEKGKKGVPSPEEGNFPMLFLLLLLLKLLYLCDCCLQLALLSYQL